jgi:hypothetical protein
VGLAKNNGREPVFPGRAALRTGVLGALVAIAAAIACSSTSSSDAGGAGAEAGTYDAACGPLPESLSVSGLDDCVATVPNPCCIGFYAFSCAAGDGGGAQCSETAACVRAVRYDQSLCKGAQAYSCPDLSGTNYATLTTPGCEQMEGVGPAGEGIRWCCGANLPPVTTLDAASPPPTGEDAATPPGMDATTPGMDATPPGMDATPPGIDATPPDMDATPPATDDAGD